MPSCSCVVSTWCVIACLVFNSGAIAAPGDHREPEHGKSEVINKTYPEASSPTLRLATFNMAAARVAPLKKIAGALTALEVDIIAIQEVDSRTERSGRLSQPEELKQMTGLNVEFSRAIDFEGGEYGLAIISRHPILRTEAFPLYSADRESRIVMVTSVQVPGFEAPITVFNTHLDTSENPELRLRQARQLNKLSINTRGIKLLMGDINDVPGTSTHLELIRYWNDSWDYSRDSRSWPSSNPEIKVDYVFTSKAQRWQIEQAVIPNSNPSWAGIQWPEITDHLPIVMTLKLLEQ